jgi:hypothetical protein
MPTFDYLKLSSEYRSVWHLILLMHMHDQLKDLERTRLIPGQSKWSSMKMLTAEIEERFLNLYTEQQAAVINFRKGESLAYLLWLKGCVERHPMDGEMLNILWKSQNYRPLVKGFLSTV